MFVAWKYFVEALEVILGNKILWLLIKELENAMTGLSSRHKPYTSKSGKKAICRCKKQDLIFLFEQNGVQKFDITEVNSHLS